MINRVVVSFSGKCELSCPFCYSPFNGKLPDPEVLENILSFCVHNEISVITFAGGDPFQYQFFRTTLENAKRMGFTVHVDTNCCGIHQKDYSIIQEYVDLLGLPIDGDADTHDKMRRRAGHYRIVIKCLEHLIEQGTRVKVNTLITAQNENASEMVQAIIAGKKIAIWSVYQFMPISSAFTKNETYSISDDRFEQIANCLRTREFPFRLEIGSQKHRRSGYLFVQTDGVVLTHDPDSPTNYLSLGNIYNNGWKQQYQRVNKSMLPELSKSRYRFRL